MTQLGNDHHTDANAPLALTEALRLIDERVRPVAGIESTPLMAGLGRVLAAPLRSDRNVPLHDNAAVDGYAVYFDDLLEDSPTMLPVVGTVAAGRPMDMPPPRGSALRVFTGAMLPRNRNGQGPDTVFMQEDCTVRGDRVVVPSGLARGANQRLAGEDVTAGSRVIEAGRRLRAEDLGLAASVGRTALPVRTPLSVALFSTGDEVCDPGASLPPGAIYDANRYMLAALLSGLGCKVADLGILPDNPYSLRSALARAAAAHDLLMSSGGVSTGAEDHVTATMKALGAVTFWRLAIKPGRPLALGHVDAARRPVPYVGLPGNPVAALVTFLRVARPLVLRLAGATEVEPALFPVRAGFSMNKKPGRREFVRCRLDRGAKVPVAHRAGPQGAGILSVAAAADGLVELPEETTRVEAGDMVPFLPFGEVR